MFFGIICLLVYSTDVCIELGLYLIYASVVCSPQTLLTGMNKFLQSLEITFRRDPTNFRPRINKLNSVKVL